MTADAAYQSHPMAQYAQTVGPTRDHVSGGHGLQPGDPAKAAQAILRALDADEPPLRLVLGGDAIDNIRARLDQITDELARWEQVVRRTAIDGPDKTPESTKNQTCDLAKAAPGDLCPHEHGHPPGPISRA
jgi:hypothetical protein